MSEDGAFSRQPRQSVEPVQKRAEPNFDPDPFSADLEAELMQELEATVQSQRQAAREPVHPAQREQVRQGRPELQAPPPPRPPVQAPQRTEPAAGP
ncbi:hypothetical protein E4O86_21025, partial [Rhizobiales bacterium L72]